MFWKGLVPFQQGLLMQKDSLSRLQQTGSGVILGMEHPLIATAGMRTTEDERAAFQSEFPEVPLENVSRGGKLTFHNPGQLVIYPILPVESNGRGVKAFIEKLVKVTSLLLQNHGVKTLEKDCPGLFTERGKIANFGLKIEDEKSTHGLAINVKNDVSLFSSQSLCGVVGSQMDSLKNYENTKKTNELSISLKN